MMPRLAILVGLLAGIVVAALILGGIYALAPESPTGVPTATAAPEASSAPASAQPSAGATPSSSEVPLVGPSASPSAEDEGTVAAFAESLAATFPLGLDATGAVSTAWDALVLPVHLWIDRDRIVRDGALGGIGPDIMARGLQTILPGVTVTP